jgi:Abi-like protein
MPFVYSTDAIRNLELAIAKDRLGSYVAETKGDVQKAIILYEMNTLFSQGLYGILQPLEIAFRNSIHNVLGRGIGKNWYDSFPLRHREAESVKEAKSHIARWSHAITPGRVVSELTFGFWTRLISRDYEKTMWVPHLHKAFPHLPKPDRAAVSLRLDSIKLLRNRIAHHERILSRDLRRDYSDIIETLEWICPTTAAWVRVTNTFQRNLPK